MDNKRKLIEHTIDSEYIFDGVLLKVYRDHALLPSGESSVREWIRHPGASAILPVFKNGDIMLIKQFRYPMSQIFYEVPAGKIDSGEDPLQTGIRELKEEVGLSATNWHYLGLFYPSIGYTDEVIHLYLATGLDHHENNTDDDEFVIPERMPFKDAVDMVHEGNITDGKTMVTILRGWHIYQQLNNSK